MRKGEGIVFRQEWKKIFKKPFTLIVILGIGLVPMLYTLVFLSAYWDPYSHTDRLPIAVVNLDQGAELDRELLEIGQDFVEGLKDNDAFKWEFPSKEEALAGLENEEYYMVIEIPEDFSANASTLLNENPVKMKLNYYTNAGKNYTGAQIGVTAIKQINAEIAKEVTEQYASTVFDSLHQIGEGLQEASDGAGDISKGAGDLADGTSVLSQNIADLNENSIAFENGVTTLASGATELANGVKQSSDGAKELQAGMDELAGGADALHTGASSVASGVVLLAEGSEQLASGASELQHSIGEFNSGLNQSVDGSVQLQENLSPFVGNIGTVNEYVQELADQLSELAEDPDSLTQEELQAKAMELQTISAKLSELVEGGKQLEDGLEQVVEGQQQLYEVSMKLAAGQKELVENLVVFAGKADEAASGAQSLSDGSAELVNGTNRVREGSSALASGLDRLDSGSDELLSGFALLTDGSKQLTEGSAQLVDGSVELSDGANELWGGTVQLHSSLQEGADEVNEIETSEATNSMFVEPTELVSHPLNEITDYGVGLTPYILSIALYAGGLMFTTSYSMREPSMTPTSGVSWFLSKYSVLIVLGVVQAVITNVVLQYGFGLRVENQWMLYLFTIITSLTFLSLILFFTAAFGKIGQYIVFIILLLQIGGSGGTFPIGLSPTFFQVIHPYLPMTYSIKGFRELLLATSDHVFIWHQAISLGVFALSFILLAVLYFVILMKKQKKGTIHEEEGVIKM
jgi:putative membrane protein